MKKVFAALLCAILLAGTACAFPVKAPASIDVADQAVLHIDVINDSNVSKDLSVYFFATGLKSNDIEISAPLSVAPKGTATVYVRVSNPLNTYGTISEKVVSRLEVHLGSDVEKRDIALNFSQKQKGGSTPGAGLFALFGGGVLESGASLILIILIILLLVAVVFKTTEKKKVGWC
ncbi:MAG: hypothetical protein WC308_04675 [archaeon]